jgi:hypothetical protein
MNDNAALEIATQFLTAQAARDVEAARPLAAPQFQVVSPGGALTDLEALFERLRTAYVSLEKLAEGQGACIEGDATVVYTHGTMIGERSNGGRFEGVRFLDRLVISDGKVIAQHIWNDFGQIPRAD